jgi:PST family polysaccharide transporter
MGANVMVFFNRRTDDLFIGTFLGPVLLGVYTVAFRILLIMLEIGLKTVATVALPTFSRLQDDVERLRSAYLTATRLSAAVSLPMFFFMLVGAAEVIQVVFGPKWEAAIPVMRVLALIGVANTLANFNNTVLTALGRPDIVFRTQTLGAVANVIGVAIAVHWGILAVAATLVARTWLVLLPLSVYYLTRHLAFGLGEYLRGYLTPLFASMPLMITGLVAHVYLSPVMGPTARLGVMLLGGGAIYVLSLALIDRALFRQLVSFARTMVRRGTTTMTPAA